MIQVKVAGRSGEAAARGAGPKEKKRFRWRYCESMWTTVDVRLIFQPA